MAKIEKIYKITLEGESELLSKMNAVNKTFEETKKRFKEVKDGSTGVFNKKNDIDQYRKALESLNKELLKNQTVSKIIKNDNDAYLRVSKALNEIEQQKAKSVQTTYEILKKANVEAKEYYSQKISSKTQSSTLQGYQQNIKNNFDKVESSGKTVEFALGYVAEQKKLEDAQKRLNFEQSEYGKELAKTNLQISNQRKENKDAAKDVLGLVDAYDELSRKQRESFNIAKNVGVEKGVYSREFQKAAGEANYYDQQLKKIDFALGRYNRNVGNYNNGIFGLNNSMAQVMREMPAFTNSAQTGFMAISNNLPILADAISAVKQRNAELKQEFLEAAAAQKAFVYEQEIAKGASIQAAAATAAVAEAQVMANYEANKAPGLWKQIGSAIFSWNSLMSIAITLLTVYGADIYNWIKGMIAGQKSVVSLTQATQDLNDARKEANKNAAKEIVNAEMLYRIIKDESVSRKERLKAAKDLQELYPKIFGSMTTEQMLVKNTTEKYNELRKSILAAAMADAIKNKISEATNKFLDKENENLDKIGAKKIEISKLEKGPQNNGAMYSGGTIGAGVTIESSKDKIRWANDDLNELRKIRKDDTDNYNAYVDKMYKIGEKYQIQGEKATKNDKTKEVKGKTYKGARLTGEQRDAIDIANAWRDNELAKSKEQKLKLEITEEDYWKRYIEIYQTYRAKVESILDGSNSKEKAITAATRKKAVDELEKATDEIYNIQSKSYDRQKDLAEKQAQERLNDVVNNPYSTEQQKLDAELQYQEESTTAQLEYNQKMIDLETQLSKNMIDEVNRREAELSLKVKSENAKRLENQILSFSESLNDIDKRKEDLRNIIEINNAVEKRNILDNKKMTLAQKNLELQKLAARLELDNINVELGNVNAKLILFELLKAQEFEFTDSLKRQNEELKKQKAILEGNKASAEQGVRTSGGSLSSPGSGTSGLSGFFTDQFKNGDGIVSMGKDKNGNDVDGSALLGEVISQSFDTATLAMNNYFDAERNRIEQSKQLAYERIELEQQQSLRYAQSKDEETAINKEAAEKKKQADKEAGERLKKIKKQELKIALATQLANIGVAAAQNPLNGITFGGAGIAMYSILAALAFAQYFSNLSAVNSAQYKKGGRFKLFAKGGRLGGPSHSNGGMPVINPVTGQKVAEMEGDEAIINKKSMADNNTYTITGKPSQIASKINAIGGGVDWFGGAILSKYKTGGIFNWNRTQPPIFNAQRQQFQASENNNDYTSERLDRAEALLESLAKEQYKKVVVSSKEISKQQRETEKQTEIGTL